MKNTWIPTLWLFCGALSAAPRDVAFTQSASSIETYDFVEVAIHVTDPDTLNPFTGVFVEGDFGLATNGPRTAVRGFCDSMDGSSLLIRFMPPSAGDYTYSVTYRQADYQKKHTGTFRVTGGHRRGPLRVDPEHRWHFIREGTGEHYFFHGTTAFWLMGWKDENIIRYSLERLHRLKINRVRVLIAGRSDNHYGEPVISRDGFSIFLAPWPADKADDLYHPGFDYARMRVEHWQRMDRMLRFARGLDMDISLILNIADGTVFPEAYSEDERRFIRYAVNRFSAFSNITWDLGDDLNTYRDDKWAHETGTLLVSWDPYKHLATSHPTTRDHQDRASDWFGFTSIQEWSRRQHALMLEEREVQKKTGRIIPQVNEEYGYEDHYPTWTQPPPADHPETLRRTAWDIAMAGAYGTAGETARRGTNIWPDTGGGWMNGRGDDTVTMLNGYAHMVDFFTSFEWWKTDPHDELVSKNAYCVAEPGRTYAIYLSQAGEVTVKLAPGRYRAEWFHAFTGVKSEAGIAEGPNWTSPKTPGLGDWALLLRRQ